MACLNVGARSTLRGSKVHKEGSSFLKYSYIILSYSYPIIKRRIAWLIGKWVSEECAQATPLVWEVLARLLSDRGPGSDAVVRLTAATVIRECSDVCHFCYLSITRWFADVFIS